MENLKIDENMRNVLGAVTNDGNENIRNVRVNPITGAIIVEANITSTNTSIGSTIPGLTQGSVLFGGIGGTLDQDNTNFFWDDTSNYLGIQTATPSANLDVQGTAIVTGDAGTADVIIGRDSGTGELSGIIVGSGLDLTAGVLTTTGGGSTGYNLFKNQGTSVTQRTTVNLTSLLTATDVSSETQLTVNVINLANDNTFVTNLANNSDFIDALIANTYFTSNLATNSNFVTNLLANTSFISGIVNIVNTSGTVSINLSSQVTGVLPIANGGTNSSTALSGSSIMVSDGTKVVQGAKGTTTTVLHGNASGTPSYSAVSLTSDVAGTLPLTNGGTGSSLSNPGANKLMGFDNTDGTVGFWTLGSGLSYDHPTHTISSTGSGNLLDSSASTQTVAQNTVGTTETTIYTISVPANTLGTKGALRTTVMFDDSLNLNNGAQATIRVKYGGTTIGSILLESSGATVTAGFSMKLENIILAAGSASSQKNYTKLSLSQDNIIFQSTAPQISYNGDGSEYTVSSVDSTSTKDITVTIQYNATANSTMTSQAILVEKI